MNMLHQILISGGSQYLNRNIAFSLFLAVLLIARLAVKRLPRKYSYGLWALLGIKSLWDFGFRTVGTRIAAAIGNRFAAASGARAFQGGGIQNASAGNAALQNASAVIGTGAGKTLVNSANAGASQMLVNSANAGASQMLVDSTNAGASQAVANAGNTASSQAVANAGNVGQLIDVSAIAPIIAVIWAVGLTAMIIWGVAGYVKLKAKTALSFASEIQNVYVCDYIDSPMVFGIVRPKIYIPSGVDIGRLNYVIGHEKMHIRRHDTLFKAIAFAILAVYWMNPLAWIAFKLFNLDMELSCDEAVLRWESVKVKKDYGKWLVFFASKGKVFGPVPTAFGETDIEKRVKNMNDKKKAGVITIVLATVATIALILCMVVKAPQLFAEPARDTEEPVVSTADSISADNNTVDNTDAVINTADGENDEIPEGEEVYTPWAGVVSEVNQDEDGTYTVVIRGESDVYGGYSSMIEVRVKVGDEVKIGDVLGVAVLPEALEFDDENAESEDAAEITERTVVITARDNAWVWPVESTIITGKFGDRHKILADESDETGETEVHLGIDLAAPKGTAVIAAAAGTVEYADYDWESGNTIKVKVSDTITYMYSHLDTINVHVGDTVKAGQSIATVGSTGASTGPHLHFSVIKDGSYIDPLGTFYELAE